MNEDILDISAFPQNPKRDQIFKTGIANVLRKDFRVEKDTGKVAVKLPLQLLAFSLGKTQSCRVIMATSFQPLKKFKQESNFSLVNGQIASNMKERSTATLFFFFLSVLVRKILTTFSRCHHYVRIP